MDVFISDKNNSVLKSLIEKTVNDKLSINIYNTLNENIIQNYIKKKIRIFQHHIKTQNDIIKYNKNIILDFINDFSKLNKKEQSNQQPNQQSNQQSKLVSINVKNEQEKPEDFNEKLKRLQSERDIPNITNDENTNFSYENLESFSSNNFQFNTLEQFNNNDNNDNNLNIQYDSNLNTDNIITKTININEQIQQPIQQTIQQPIQQTIQQPIQQSIQQPIQQSIQQPIQQTINHKEMNIIINSKDRNWRDNINRFKYNILTKKKDTKIVKIPVYENSQIIPNKYYELDNISGWVDDNGISHNKYDSNKDYGSVLFEYEKIIDTDKQIIITDMDNINKIIVEKIIIHKNDVSLPNTFIYFNIPQINNSKLLLTKEKEIDDYIYYTNNNIINVSYNIDKYTFELFNYDNTYIGSNNKDFYKILNINYENYMLNITIDGNIPTYYINSHYISFNNLNTDDIKINIFCKKLSTIYHKIVGISDNTILVHYEDNDIQIFNKEISGYIFIETLQNIIFLKIT